MPRKDRSPFVHIDPNTVHTEHFSFQWGGSDYAIWVNRELITAKGFLHEEITPTTFVQVGIPEGERRIHNLATIPGTRRYNGPFVEVDEKSGTVTKHDEVRARWARYIDVRPPWKA